MSAPKKGNRTGFIRQTLLILLPLIGLAGFGVFSLQQDRRLARLAAVEQAQSIADFLMPRLIEAVQAAARLDAAVFSVDADGNLVFPGSAPGLNDLPHLQGRSESSQTAATRFHGAIEMLRNGEVREAAGTLAELFTHHPDAQGETGLPIAPLAGFKLLELQMEMSHRLSPVKISFDAFCAGLVNRPSVWTPVLLDKAEKLAITAEDQGALRNWRTLWLQHEHAREMFRLAQAGIGNLWDAPEMASPQPGLFLMDLERQDTNRWFSVVEFASVAERLEAVLKDTTAVPSYLRLDVRVAGAVITGPDTNSGLKPDTGQTAGDGEVLASAVRRSRGRTGMSAARNLELLRVDVVLVDAAPLYRHQRTRTWWFAGFIALSSAVAVFGLAGAWRSFRQQERLNEMKSNFVSSVSHELRAPIASVRLMAENLESGKVVEEPRRMEYFRFISQECRRLSSLVENVLDFSRIEQDRKQYEFEPVDLRRIVDSTVQLLQPPAAERRVSLSVEYSGGNLPTIIADGKALRQVLVNLVDNAIKHSPIGAAVTVGVESAPSGHGVLLWVEDSGEGIPPSEHEKIFERFYRLGSELRRETQGVGIGLSIVKHVVEAHRGRIHVRSAPAQGSRFTIELPGDGMEEKGDNQV